MLYTPLKKSFFDLRESLIKLHVSLVLHKENMEKPLSLVLEAEPLLKNIFEEKPDETSLNA